MKYFPRSRFFLLLFVTFLIGGCFSAQAQDSMQRWQSFEFSKSALKAADVATVPLEDLKLLRGIVFGLHGRIFKDADIRVYLEAQNWYKANSNFDNSMLNNIERRNLDIIRDAEAGKHETVQPRRHALLARAPVDRQKTGHPQWRRMACAARGG